MLPGQLGANSSETSTTATSPRNSLAEVPSVAMSLPVSAHHNITREVIALLHHQAGRLSSVSPLPRQESDPSFNAAFGSSQSFDKEFNFGSFRSSISEDPPREEDDEK